MNYEKMWKTLKSILEIRISENLGTGKATRYVEMIRLMEFIEEREK